MKLSSDIPHHLKHIAALPGDNFNVRKDHYSATFLSYHVNRQMNRSAKTLLFSVARVINRFYAGFKKTRFFKKAQPSGFLGFYRGFLEKIGKIIQELSNLKP